MPPACLCILPARFGVHEATAATNVYVRTPDVDGDVVAERGRLEAEGLITALRGAGVDVLALDERDKGGDSGGGSPDAVFPNNWFVVHDKALVICPMHNELRRRERWGGFRGHLARAGVPIERMIDMTAYEREGRALEGTGSLVFARAQGVGYAARSARTDEGLVRELAAELGVEAVVFDARDVKGTPVYHTNVLMSVADDFAIVCAERVVDRGAELIERLGANGRAVVEITPEQMDRFCANALAVPTRTGGTVLAMSVTAYTAFTPEQRNALASHATILHAPIPTIEGAGGGSVRCMIAML